MPLIFFRSVALLACALCATAQARSFQGTVSHVGDGDSLWVRPLSGGAPRAVRLHGIDAPEICQAGGTQARDALAARAQGRRVTVDARGRDDFGRILGQVHLQGQDLGGWMVAGGHAWSYRFRRDAGPYAALEAKARVARLGVWAQRGAVEPRLFRKRHGGCVDAPTSSAAPRAAPR